ncbi:hypothetical protein MKK75_33185 [Methylobacterium sp. J-030]|uniref:hypothetical protein n=1 Tax=Methylobacterium sp. J-030 TaxID=2836627 RepID=UPI001FB871CD|nr:hypothetical protein [Methylobacterium sp. J-030]MCJ2073589.1 hypothetical protein [Methylobacterium sp. J-030]
MAEKPTLNHAAHFPGKINEVLTRGKPVSPTNERGPVAISGLVCAAATVDAAPVSILKHRGREAKLVDGCRRHGLKDWSPTTFTFPRVIERREWSGVVDRVPMPTGETLGIGRGPVV